MTAPLKPCPFCGGPVHVERGDGGVGTINCAKGSTCIGSGMLVGFRLTDEETAIAAWNTRADAPELVALVNIAKLAIAAVVEVQTYQQPDDPWTENALTMRELDAFEFDVDDARAALAAYEALR